MSAAERRSAGNGATAAVLVGILSALGIGPAQAFPTRAFYPLDPGNWWAYREYLNQTPTEGHDVTFVDRGTVHINGVATRVVIDGENSRFRWHRWGGGDFWTNDASGVRIHGWREEPEDGEPGYLVTLDPPVTLLAPDAILGQSVVTSGSYTTSLGVGGTFNITVTPEAFEEVTADTSCNGSFAPSVTPPAAWALRVRIEGAFVGGPAEEAFTEQAYYVSGVGPAASVETEGQDIWLERICAAGIAGQRTVRADFDNDDRTDPAYFRASDGTWHVLQSATGTALEGAWGQSGDSPQPGDFDGDGLADMAVFRPSDGTWYILTSGSSYATYLAIPWGMAGDQPVARDYDGDGVTDIAVFRPSDGFWHALLSTSGFTRSESMPWGMSGDVALPRDFDGDGRADLIVFRPSDGTWYIKKSTSDYADFVALPWGMAGDTALTGDYDGDGKSDLAVFRPDPGSGTATWYIALENGTSRVLSRTWGAATDIPVSGDYDGDGATDITVFRDGGWFTLLSSKGFDPAAYQVVYWGAAGDTPVNRK